MLRITTAAAAVATIFGVAFPAQGNFRHMPVEALTDADFKKIPSGAAIWFHKKGKTWFHLPLPGKGHMRIDRRVWAFVRVKPNGRDWACEPMTFALARNKHATVRIYKEKGTWSVRFNLGTQTSTIKGLACSSGS